MASAALAEVTASAEQFTQALGQPRTKRGNYPIPLSLSFTLVAPLGSEGITSRARRSDGFRLRSTRTGKSRFLEDKLPKSYAFVRKMF
jgi:hypothetical protein